ncbi:MAG TPA: AraC family transcriptional regulator, partial [Puia sp.]|nr:AraC family transcriptional regulator [Puia sp.]
PDEGSSFRFLHTKTRAEEYPWQYHYHPEYEIVCVLHGSGTRHVGNHFSRYEHGDLVFLGPNLPHAGFGLNAHGPHEEIVIQVKEEVFQQSILSRPEMGPVTKLLENSRCGIYFTGQTKQRITRKLNRALKLSPFERFVEFISILQLMASTTEFELMNPSLTISPLIGKNSERLQKIFTYVEQHFQEDVDIKEVAALVNLSVPSFCNYFKKIVNSTFTEFLNKYRVQRACLSLQQEKTIAETCFECGFNNVPYFNKVFKSVTGKTPSSFKKEKLHSN